MDIIANDLNRFDEDIEDFNSWEKKLRTNYELLVTHMNDLNKMWEGEAHNRFLDTFAIDSEKVLNLLLQLGEIDSDLRFASEAYGVCERKVATIIGSITV